MGERNWELPGDVLRLSVQKFKELLKLISPMIRKNIHLEEFILCKTKLEIALGYLAN